MLEKKYTFKLHLDDADALNKLVDKKSRINQLKVINEWGVI